MSAFRHGVDRSNIDARYLFFLPGVATTLVDVRSSPNMDTAQDHASSARPKLAPMLAFHTVQTNSLVATLTMEVAHFSF